MIDLDSFMKLNDRVVSAPRRSELKMFTEWRNIDCAKDAALIRKPSGILEYTAKARNITLDSIVFNIPTLPRASLQNRAFCAFPTIQWHQVVSMCALHIHARVPLCNIHMSESQSGTKISSRGLSQKTKTCCSQFRFTS